MRPSIAAKHDDLHLGTIVFVVIVITLFSIAILPRNPQLAQTVWLGAMAFFAIIVGIFDYGRKQEKETQQRETK